MKKAVMTAAVLGVLMAGGIGVSRGDSAAQDSGEYVGSAVDEIRIQAAEELKKAFVSEVSAFFKSDDLGEGQAKLEESIRTYINNYSADEEKLSEAKESLDTLLENTEGLSVEEIQDRISGIFADEQ